MNSYKYLPDVGTVIVFELPSPPETFPATSTAVGIVIVWAVDTTLISSIILPNLPVNGKFKNESVIEPDVVIELPEASSKSSEFYDTQIDAAITQLNFEIKN